MAAGICLLSINEDFNEVSIACKSISSQWKELAKHLNIDKPIVESIQVYNVGQGPVSCLDELLSTWLRQTGSTNQPVPTWRILCTAISNIDRRLSKKIWEDHTRECSQCAGVCSSDEVDSEAKSFKQQQQQSAAERTQLHILRNTSVAKAVKQGNAKVAAEELKKDFKEILKMLITEISKVDIEQLRFEITDYFKEEERGNIDEELEKHLSKIEDYDRPSAILNYFIRHDFIGYINYSLVKVFRQLVAKSWQLLDQRIEEYEKDYQCFLELTLSQIHDVFQQCPDLRPEYPAGIPKFTIYLQSEWEGKSMLNLKEYLKQCLSNSDCVDQLMIAKISRSCIIVTFAILPHIAREVLKYLTNDNVIESMKKEGISVNISKQLMKYIEKELIFMEQALSTLKLIDTDDRLALFMSQVGHADLDRFSDTTSGFDERNSDTNDYSRVDELGVDEIEMETTTVDTYKYLVNILKKRIHLLEGQLESHQQKMTELEDSRDDDLLKVETMQSLHEIKVEFKCVKSINDQLQNYKLLKAAENGDAKQIEKLIKSQTGVDVNAISSDETPLHLASCNGHYKAVKLLISLGANVNAKDIKGDIPLHVASYAGHSDVVKVLLSLGATVNEKNIGGNTALHSASSHGHSDIVSMLLSHGATVNVKDHMKSTPLHEASLSGHSDVVIKLLSHEARVNEKNNEGDTPLHCASMYDHIDTVEALLSYGAIVNSINEYRQTPLHMCLMGESHITATAELLISHGADVYNEDKDDDQFKS